MASFSLVVEDSSPLITYSPAGAWVDTTDDTLATSYSGTSLHATNAQDATAAFTFNGTGVSFFGGRRPGYGTYTFLVDGEVVSVGDASSTTPTTREALASVSNLPFGSHTATLKTNGGGTIDLDWIEIATQVGAPGSQLAASTVDDMDPRITYLPSPDAWQTNTGPMFMGNSLHFTKQQNTAASMTFEGEAIALYGAVSPDHADVRVSIDGQENLLPVSASSLHTQVLLYYSDGLGPGEHKLVLSPGLQTTATPFIDLDSIAVFASTPGANGSSALSTGGRGPSLEFVETSRGPAGMKTIIIGATVAGILALLLILGLILMLLRRQRQRNRKTIPVMESSSPKSPDLPMQKTPVMLEAGYSFAKPALSFTDYAAARHSIAPSYYGGFDSEPESRAPSRASSSASTAPMLKVPAIGLPQPPKRAITTEQASDFVVPGCWTCELICLQGGEAPPTRPSQRPPTMNF
ncbi:hypothetical protein BDN72DRAFT_797444 [Pluteus cervinus]|uniref:Uncharacterized protein n=1 Tax=Pluteus cervinus TaxID=181527 RepID=A0ACD3ASI9_9AGAR|nr:hypothetical protein BDN72DRAFT_797444 [Pluteus cervinus]